MWRYVMECEIGGIYQQNQPSVILGMSGFWTFSSMWPLLIDPASFFFYGGFGTIATI
jgi:hypothetical protein